jgi:tetratricopeptide (TPR) repeat protein
MNLTRGWLSAGKPGRPAPARPFAGLQARLALPLVLAAASIGPGVHSLLAFGEQDFRDPQAAEADVLPGSNRLGAPDLSLDPDSAAKADALAAFSQAIIAEDNADSDTALADYQKALSLDPGYTELAVKVAFELARRGDPSGGIQVLKDSIKASPKAPLAYIYLSQIYEKDLGKLDLALKYAQQALDLDPSNLASCIAVYEIDEATHQPGPAAALLDRASKQNSSDPQYWLQLGDFYIKSFGNDTVPAEAIKKVTGIYRHALALDGDNSATLVRVANFFARSEQEKDAIPLYLKALKLSAANPPDGGDDTINAIRESLAICFDAAGRTPEAITTLRQLIKDDPLQSEYYGTLCDLYEKEGNTDAALNVCKQMLLLNQSDFRNYVREAALLMKEKKYDSAIQTLSDARAKFPSEAQITYSLGLALSEAKHYPEAVAIFEQAEEEASQGETEMLDGGNGAQFYFAYGAAAEEANQVDKAAELLKKSIELDPSGAAEAYNYIGFMWVDRGLKLDEGAALIKKALQMDPGNPAYVDSLGWYYFKKGDFAKAVEILKKAATAIQPEDAVVDEHLGDAYSADNDMPHALDYWQKASAIDRENKEIAVKIAGARQKLARQGSPPHTTP